MAKHPPSKDESVIWLIQQSDNEGHWELLSLHFRDKSRADQQAALMNQYYGGRARVIEYRAVEGLNGTKFRALLGEDNGKT